MKMKSILIITIVVFSLMCSCAYAEELTSWTCLSCGTLNSGNFCTNCGAQRNESGSWVCKNCSTMNEGNFCSNCGSSKETANMAAHQNNRTTSSTQQQADKDKLNDYMIATIDGTEYTFVLKEVRLATQANRIYADFETYNLRGKVLYHIQITLVDGISPGVYKSDSSNAFAVSSTRNSLIAQGEAILQERKGSFTLELQYRSEDWMTYSGKFTAHLVSRSTMFSKMETMDILNAEFSFTIP